MDYALSQSITKDTDTEFTAARPVRPLATCKSGYAGWKRVAVSGCGYLNDSSLRPLNG